MLEPGAHTFGHFIIKYVATTLAMCSLSANTVSILNHKVVCPWNWSTKWRVRVIGAIWLAELQEVKSDLLEKLRDRESTCSSKKAGNHHHYTNRSPTDIIYWKVPVIMHAAKVWNAWSGGSYWMEASLVSTSMAEPGISHFWRGLWERLCDYNISRGPFPPFPWSQLSLGRTLAFLVP